MLRSLFPGTAGSGAALILFTLLCGGAQAASPSPERAPSLGPLPRASGGAAAQQPQQRLMVPETRIAAVVNDDVISVGDLAGRVRMIMLSSRIEDTPDNRKRIAGQVLRNIVDEKLQLQEAKRLNVTASPEEVKQSIAGLETQNNMKPGQLEDYLKSQGIDKGTLADQLTASIVWSKLLKRTASQTNTVSDEEVDDAMKRLKLHEKDPQSRVGEIFLAVDKPEQEQEVKLLAEKLTQQMRQGVRFSAIASQFSQAPTAAVGGDIGWVRPEELNPELGKIVAQLKPGELSAPIRTPSGYYLMLVIDRRTGTGGSSEQDMAFRIAQVVFAVPPTAPEAARRTAMTEAQNVATTAKSCQQMTQIGKERGSQLSSEGRVKMNEIAPQLRDIIGKLEVNQPSQPIVQKNGIGVIMVCEKAAPATAGVTRDEVTDMLLRQRLDTIARRYMRDLRRTAFVDVRLGAG